LPLLTLADAELHYGDLPLLDRAALAVEAGVRFGWERYADDVVSIDRFGASAPAPDLYEHFGLTAPKITERVLEHMNQREFA